MKGDGTIAEQGDKLTCVVCRAEGVGIGFAHRCGVVLMPDHVDRLEAVLSDCYAQLDAVFDERLMARVLEEMHAIHLKKTAR